MNILTSDNKVLDLSTIEEFITPTQFTVVDLGSEVSNYDGESDIIFPKLLYIEEVTTPALVCVVDDKYEVTLPLTWFIFIGDEDVGEVESIPITSLNARNFNTISTSPIKGFRHKFVTIRPKKVLMEYDWTLPKIKKGQTLAMPYNDDECIYITHTTSRIPQIVYPSDFI